MEFKAKSYDVLEEKVIPEYPIKAKRWSKLVGDMGSTVASKTDDRTDAGWR
jgi:hypothetical protein